MGSAWDSMESIFHLSQPAAYTCRLPNLCPDKAPYHDIWHIYLEELTWYSFDRYAYVYDRVNSLIDPQPQRRQLTN